MTVFFSLKRRVGERLYDLYCPYFSLKVIMKLTMLKAHSVMLCIEMGMHLPNYVHEIRSKLNFDQHDVSS